MATHGLQFRKALGCQERGKFVWWRNGQESTTQNPGADVDAAGEDAFLTVAADRNCRRLGFRAGCLRFRQQHRDKDRRQKGVLAGGTDIGARFRRHDLGRRPGHPRERRTGQQRR